MSRTYERAQELLFRADDDVAQTSLEEGWAQTDSQAVHRHHLGFSLSAGAGSAGGYWRSATESESKENLTDGSEESSSSGGSDSESSYAAKVDGVLDSFLFMELRRMKRVRNGRVAREGLASLVGAAAQQLVIFLLLMKVFNITTARLGLRQLWGIPAVATAALVVWTVAITNAVPEHTFTAWASTEVYAFCLWAVWWWDEPLPRGNLDVVCVPKDVESPICFNQEQVNAAAAFAIVFGLTCLVHLPHRLVLPCILRFGCQRGRCLLLWRDVRREPGRPGAAFSYKPSGLMGWQRSEFAYWGSTDEEGRPHGEGTWRDTSFHGECLRGQWVHGEPAVFTSREYGTGAQFLQCTVAYATSRSDCRPENIGASSLFLRKDSALRYGVAQVEVSFAGGFFPFLPAVRRHQEESSVAELVHGLGLSTSSAEPHPVIKLEVVSEKELVAQAGGGAEAEHDSRLRLVQVPVQFMDGDHFGFVTPQGLAGASSLAKRPQEALVFIHGYNCDLATALGRVAQTMALGNMDPHIVPFVFSYSAGMAASYFQVKRHMGEYGSDLATFLSELSLHFQEVHILTHSCGAEFFFANWPSIQHCFVPSKRLRTARQGRWVPLGLRTGSDGHRLHLATLTLMNPDVLVSTVAHWLPSIMQVAEHFTTYNDANDLALAWSCWLQRILPRSWQSRRVESDETEVFGRSLQTLWLERSGGGDILAGSMVGRAGSSPRAAAWRFRPRCPEGLPQRPAIPGDGSIDIIDCSNIDQNVHKLRHNYYMLNTHMVEDICELVGRRITAPYRQRLCQVEANVFNFLSPPSHLMG